MTLNILILLLIIVIIGFYMAWNIGSNDLANAMASAVGAKAIKLKTAMIFGGILAFIGAVFVGSNVTDTIRKGIVDPEMIKNEMYLMYGAISALLGASFWITLATWKELPISTTHSIVGGMVGFGIAVGGVGMVNWLKIGSVVASWAISPLIGGVLSYFIFKIIFKYILNTTNPLKAAKKIAPIFIGATFFIISASLFLKTPAGTRIGWSMEYFILLSLLVGIFSAFVGRILILQYFKNRNVDENQSSKVIYKNVEEIFRRLQVMTSCYVAFALGANDVANAIGPMATAWSVGSGVSLGATVEVPYYLLVLGGVGIIIGMATWGYRVIKTIGTKITHLTNTRGFSIDFGAATSVLVASKLGMPVSTTHAVVGAVIGVGLARGLQAIDLSIIKKIAVTWVVTVPIAAATAGGIFLLLINVFPV
jgi:PiT family inorganic phosphate transporter